MATGFALTWADIVTLTRVINKQIPSASINIALCDLVSTDIYKKHTWRWALSKLETSGTISLVDGTQDYTAPSDIWRLSSARIVRTDTSPNQNKELDIADQIPADLAPYSYTAIQAISWEPAFNKLRLERCVRVPSGTTLEIRGTYQPYPTRITDLTQSIFFPDVHQMVAIEGIMYWYYKTGDDPRADAQFIKYQAAIQEMKQAEDFTAEETIFPSETIAPQRDVGGGLNIFNW